MAAELLEQFTQAMTSLTLIPSSGGRFEVMVDDALIYSKKESKRHADPGEVVQLFSEHTGIGE
ncbi:MAG: Rdx family protein [Caldilineaceae bacterium]|nr:Rdx family protein [Caldilineaceae bacterium]MBP9070933.1 Rdx family protein [Caldilineaceae bacterium]